jgi:hypothetical protein
MPDGNPPSNRTWQDVAFEFARQIPAIIAAIAALYGAYSAMHARQEAAQAAVQSADNGERIQKTDARVRSVQANQRVVMGLPAVDDKE